jgi:hypothetical protein
MKRRLAHCVDLCLLFSATCIRSFNALSTSLKQSISKPLTWLHCIAYYNLALESTLVEDNHLHRPLIDCYSSHTERVNNSTHKNEEAASIPHREVKCATPVTSAVAEWKERNAQENKENRHERILRLFQQPFPKSRLIQVALQTDYCALCGMR